MTTPPESAVKVKDCAFCAESPAILLANRNPSMRDEAMCKNHECPIVGIWMPLAQWNRRPREEALEAALREAHSALFSANIDLAYFEIDLRAKDFRMDADLVDSRRRLNGKLLASISEVLREGAK